MSKEAKYTELQSSVNPSVETLFKIYKKNKYHARIYYMNENNSQFINRKIVLFEEPNGDFSIVSFSRKFGISKTNIMYNRETREFSIIKKGNKFYYKIKQSIKPLTYGNIKQYSDNIINEIIKRVPWLRFMSEVDGLCLNVSLNTMYTKKIFSLEKALKYEYKLPLPSAKILHSNKTYHARYVKYYVDYMINRENLHNTLPTYDFDMFYDTLKMAKTLDRKVNCSWSARRLKEEHDKWSNEITDIVFTEGNRVMRVSDVFVQFAEASGFKLLQTTKEMNLEGRKQNHCVATYVSSVENGHCAIYSISDYTLELGRKWINNYTKSVMFINQFRGYKNSDATKELYDMVKAELNKFNGIECENLFDVRNNDLPF